VRKVLIVDDSPLVRHSIQEALEPWGLEIEQAENGAEALARMQAASFDLVYLDLVMPVLDGPSFMRVIRARKVDVPVILINTGTATSLVTFTIRLGASEYLAKPFTAETIRAATARVLRLDPEAMRVAPVRLLLQHPDETLAPTLRKLLPAHVALDAGPLLADALDLARRGDHSLALIDAGVLDGDAGMAAGLLRKALPAAAILSVSRGEAPVPFWHPEGDLDGTIPGALDGPLVHDFLYLNFLRPLVFAQGTLLRAAGFRGEAHHIGAYFGALTRALQARCTRERAAQDMVIDLTALPDEGDRVAALVRAVSAHYANAGGITAWRLQAPVQQALARQPEFQRALFA